MHIHWISPNRRPSHNSNKHVHRRTMQKKDNQCVTHPRQRVSHCLHRSSQVNRSSHHSPVNHSSRPSISNPVWSSSSQYGKSAELHETDLRASSERFTGKSGRSFFVASTLLSLFRTFDMAIMDILHVPFPRPSWPVGIWQLCAQYRCLSLSQGWICLLFPLLQRVFLIHWIQRKQRPTTTKTFRRVSWIIQANPIESHDVTIDREQKSLWSNADMLDW